MKTVLLIGLTLGMIIFRGEETKAQDDQDLFVTGFTSSGLALQLNKKENYGIERLILAQSKVFGENQYLGFDDVFSNEDFQDVVRANELFAVLTEVPKGVKFENNYLAIDSWGAQFEFDRTQPVEKRPLLLFKFIKRPLTELLEEKYFFKEFGGTNSLQGLDLLIGRVNEKIAACEAFPDQPRPTGLSSKEYEYLEERNDYLKTTYTKLKDILEDPFWTGIIALNMKLDHKSLPPNLQTLATSSEQLYWDIIGIEANYSGSSTPSSKIFGVIDYEAPASRTLYDLPSTPSSFLFRDLLFFFQNSILKTAQFRAELRTEYVVDYWDEEVPDFKLKDFKSEKKRDPEIYPIKGTIIRLNGLYRSAFHGLIDGLSANGILETLSLSSTRKKH